MSFLPSLSPEELHTYHHTVTSSVSVRSHFDVYVWLQGDMQRFIPHDIMIAAWGSFGMDAGLVQHDILSSLPGVRSQNSSALTLNPLLIKLFNRWAENGKKPLVLNPGINGFALDPSDTNCALGNALQTMRSAIVHGIVDERGSHDCLYVTFSHEPAFSSTECAAMAAVLPYIDTALRQVKHLPHQSLTSNEVGVIKVRATTETYGLSLREIEILKWVALGKTNPEIGCILEISEFTVKNHMQRVFKKLNVTNRAQAVGKFQAHLNHV